MIVVYYFFSPNSIAECPEEEYDPRSLFEKLQEQKDKKQTDFDEQFKFSKRPQTCKSHWIL